MTDDSLRTVALSRTGKAKFTVANERGGVISIGEGADTDFTPVELLLAAIAGCSAIDVDHITGRRAEPVSFDVRCDGEKFRDDDGNHMRNLQAIFDVVFPSGEDGDRARESLPRAVSQSRDRLCTVSRTVQLGTPVELGLIDR